MDKAGGTSTGSSSSSSHGGHQQHMDNKTGNSTAATTTTNPPVRLRIKLLNPGASAARVAPASAAPPPAPASVPPPPALPHKLKHKHHHHKDGPPPDPAEYAAIMRKKLALKLGHRVTSADEDWVKSRLAHRNGQAAASQRSTASESSDHGKLIVVSEERSNQNQANGGASDEQGDSDSQRDTSPRSAGVDHPPLPEFSRRQRSSRRDGGAKTWMSAAGAFRSSVPFDCGGKKKPFSTQMLVWAKLEGHPWWPARVATSSEMPDEIVKSKKSDHVCVKFYGLSGYAYVWMKAESLAHYEENFDEFFKQDITPVEKSELEAALGEVRKVCARRAARCVDALRSRGLYKTVAKHPIRPDRRRHKGQRIGKDSGMTQKEKDAFWEHRRKRKSEKKQDTETNDDTDSEPSDDNTSLESVPKKKMKIIPGSMEMDELDKMSSDLDGSPDVKESMPGEKNMGPDGYYYECVICNTGGDLLCCEFCPRVYHMECLTPPLQHTPPGKWQCPACPENPPAVKMPTPGCTVVKDEDAGEVGEQESTPSANSKLRQSADTESATVAVKRKRQKEVGPEVLDSKISGNDIQAQAVVQNVHLDKPRKKRKDGELGAVKKKSKDQENKEKLSAGKCEVCGTDFCLSGSSPVFCKGCGQEIGNKPAKSGKKASEDVFPLFPIENQVDRILGCRTRPTLSATDSTCCDVFLPKDCQVLTSGCPAPHRQNINSGVRDNVGGIDEAEKCSGVAEWSGDVEGKIFNVSNSKKGVFGAQVKVAALDNEQTPEPMEVDNDGVNIDSLQGKKTDVLQPKDVSTRCLDSPRVVTKDSGNYVSDSACESGRSNAGEIVGSPNLRADTTHSADSPKPKVITSADKKEAKPGQAEVKSNLEFHVKWVGRAHIHDEWVGEDQLVALAKRKLDNYKLKFGTTAMLLVDEQWYKPQRIIARKTVKGKIEMVLVKWTGLSYEECTWERIDEPVITENAGLLAKFDRFEAEALASNSTSRGGHPGKIGPRLDIEPLQEQPKELQGGTLFPHQMEALNWLRKSWLRRRNVILADEMGLGKTISACAFLSTLYHEFGVRMPCLVLVPLSTMPNWMAEFALWAPSLNILEYHGTAKARAAIRQFEWYAGEPEGKKQRPFKFNVMLTTYEMVINDSSQLRPVPWESLIVDEGHRLKNSESKLCTLLNTYSFAHRVLLTGTPLQNNLGEMYNLLDFLKPDQCPPTLAAFQEQFNSLSTTEQVEELKKLVAPHMLRRLKKDAMKNIPPKMERMVPVELTSVQAEYYRLLLTRNYQLLRQGLKAGQQKSMLNIVMQLRKVCNHPYLIGGTEPDQGTAEFLQEMRINASAKLKFLHVLLGKLKEQGHRVLIFSQMAKLLDILEDYLTYQFGSESYERVSGNVPLADRQAAIARFNQDTSRFVFLLSTRSCGLGINLATADTVIIYDSDFNPHADIQAMNRAHRIGQSKILLVYRLVVRSSVEERILQLAKKKLMLDHLFANKSGSQKEVEDILRWGTEELFQEDPLPPGGSKDAPITLDCSDGDGADEAEGKQRRRVSGLGDVYGDKCLKPGRSKVVWDDAAIARLLDRSDQSAGINDSAEGEQEGEILGSMKAWDSNEQDGVDEVDVEEIPSKDSEAIVVERGAKGDEDDDWERLLRKRWEKLQMQKEAVLGRGKRQRKIVSYNEGVPLKSPLPTSSESEAREEEDEEAGYTAAGRAFKLKLAKLRDRQKERIALRGKDSTEELNAETLGNDGRTEGTLTCGIGLPWMSQTSSAGLDATVQHRQVIQNIRGSSLLRGPNDTQDCSGQVGSQKLQPPINVETHTQGNASFPHRYYTVMGMPVEAFQGSKVEQGQIQGGLPIPGSAVKDDTQETQHGLNSLSTPDARLRHGDTTLPAFSSGLLALSGPGQTFRQAQKEVVPKTSTDCDGRLSLRGSGGLSPQLDLGLTSYSSPRRSSDSLDEGDLRHKKFDLERQESVPRFNSLDSSNFFDKVCVSGQSGLGRRINVDVDNCHRPTQHELRQAGKSWISGDAKSAVPLDAPLRMPGPSRQPPALQKIGISMGLCSQDAVASCLNTGGVGPSLKTPTAERGQGGEIWKNGVPASSFGLGLLKDVPGLLAADLSRAEFSPLPLTHARQFLDSQTRDASALAFLDTLAVGKQRAFDEDRRREQQQEPWTEEELDVLWTGVRRHGFDWEAMSADRRLHFHESRTAKDLEKRWLQDEVKSKKVFGDTLGQSTIKNTAAVNGVGPLESSLRRLPDLQAPSRIAETSPTAALLSEALKVCSKNKPEVAVEKFLQEKKMLDRRDSIRWPAKSSQEKSPFSSIKYNTTLGLGMPEDEKIRLPEINTTGITVDFQKLPDLSQLRPASASSNPMTTLQGLKSSEAHYGGDPSANSTLMFPLSGNLDSLNVDSRHQAYFDKMEFKGMKSLPEMPMLEQSQRLQPQLRQPVDFSDSICQRSLDGMGLQFSPGPVLGLGGSRTPDCRSTVSQFGIPGVDHRKFSSRPGDGGFIEKRKVARHFSSGKSSHLSRESAAKGTSNLPHWLKDAFKATEPPAPLPSLAPTIAAVAQAVASLHSGNKSLLPPPALPLPPLKAPTAPGRKKKGRVLPRKQASATDTVSIFEGQYPHFLRGIPQFHQPGESSGIHSSSVPNISRNFPIDLGLSRSSGVGNRSFALPPFSANISTSKLSISSELCLTPPLPALDYNSLLSGSFTQSSGNSTLSDLLKRRNFLETDPASISGSSFSLSRPSCLNLEPSLDILTSQVHRPSQQGPADLNLSLLQKGRAGFGPRQTGTEQQPARSEAEQQRAREFLTKEPKTSIRSEPPGLAAGRSEHLKQVAILPPWLRSAAVPPSQVLNISSRDSDVKVKDTTPRQGPVIVLGLTDDSSSETQSDPGIRGTLVDQQEALNEVSSDETISDN